MTSIITTSAILLCAIACAVRADPYIGSKSYSAARFFKEIQEEGQCVKAIKSNIGFIEKKDKGSGLSFEAVGEGLIAHDCLDREGKSCTRIFPCASEEGDECIVYEPCEDCCDYVLDEKAKPFNTPYLQYFPNSACFIEVAAKSGLRLVDGYSTGVRVQDHEDMLQLTRCHDEQQSSCSRFIGCESVVANKSACFYYEDNGDACLEGLPEYNPDPQLVAKSTSANILFEEHFGEGECVEMTSSNDGFYLIQGYQSGVQIIEYQENASLLEGQLSSQGARFFSCLDTDNLSCYRVFKCTSETNKCVDIQPSEDACQSIKDVL